MKCLLSWQDIFPWIILDWVFFGTVSFLCNTSRYYGTRCAMSLFSNLHFEKTKNLPSNTSCRVLNLDLHLCCCSRVLAMDHTSIREFWRSEEWERNVMYVFFSLCIITSDSKKIHLDHTGTPQDVVNDSTDCNMSQVSEFLNRSTLRCPSLVSHF